MALNANNQKELYASVYGCNRGSIYKTKNFDKKRKLIKVLGDRKMILLLILTIQTLFMR